MSKAIIFTIFPLIIVLTVFFKQSKYQINSKFFSNHIWTCKDVLFIFCIAIAYKFITYYLAFNKNIVNYNLILLLGSLTPIVGVLCVFIILKLRYSLPFSILGFRNNSLKPYIVLSLKIFFLEEFILNFPVSFFEYFYSKHFLFTESGILSVYFKSSGLWLLICILILLLLAPLVEECLYRGILYTPFFSKVGREWTFVLSSCLWTLSHGLLDGPFLQIFIDGLLLMYLYEKSKSLIPGILLHSLYNLPFVLIYLYSSFVIKTPITGHHAQVMAFNISLSSLVIFLLLCLFTKSFFAVKESKAVSAV